MPMRSPSVGLSVSPLLTRGLVHSCRDHDIVRAAKLFAVEKPDQMYNPDIQDKKVTASLFTMQDP